MAFSPNAQTVYADGPAGSPLQPAKSEIRKLLKQYENVIEAFLTNGGLIFASKALLDASLNYAANTMAWVLGDATVANNGIYRKIGASGTGSWTRVADLPFSFIIASDVGAGTANAIQATTSIPVSESALIWMNVFEANTASPVTVSFNGGSALTIKTNTGNNIATGGLVSGMIVLGVVSGSTFRILNDQVSSAIIAAAEAAQAAAEAAAVSVNIKNVNDRAALKGLDTVVTTLAFLREGGREGVFKWTTGDFSARITADTQEGIYVKANAIASTTGAWVRQYSGLPNVKWFGAVGDGVTVDTAAFAAGYAVSKALAVPVGTFLAEIVIPDAGMLIGEYLDLSIIKTPPGANKTAIAGYEAFTLFGSSVVDPTRGANKTVIYNLTIDGNRANVTTSGEGIAIWGYSTTVERVRIRNCRGVGLRTEWTDGAVSMEGHFRDIVIDTTGSHGWQFYGPHDANVADVIIIDASQNADNSAYGLVTGTGGGLGFGNGRFFNVHIWHRSGIVNRCAAGVRSGGVNEFIGCHFEGCRVNAHFGAKDLVSSCRIYAVFGANGDAMAYLLGNEIMIENTLFETTEGAASPNSSTTPNPDCYAIFMAPNVSGVKVSGKFNGFQKRTPFNFGSSVGFNFFSGVGYTSAGGVTAFGGTVNANDAIDYVQGGTVINYRKPFPHGAYANDSGAATGGVPIGGIYRNSSTGAMTVRVT